eukprot:2413325-Amphidinium_carterae.1
MIGHHALCPGSKPLLLWFGHHGFLCPLACHLPFRFLHDFSFLRKGSSQASTSVACPWWSEWQYPQTRCSSTWTPARTHTFVGELDDLPHPRVLRAVTRQGRCVVNAQGNVSSLLTTVLNSGLTRLGEVTANNSI